MGVRQRMSAPVVARGRCGDGAKRNDFCGLGNFEVSAREAREFGDETLYSYSIIYYYYDSLTTVTLINHLINRPSSLSIACSWALTVVHLDRPL